MPRRQRGVSLRSRVLIAMGAIGLLSIAGSVWLTMTVTNYATEQLDDRLYTFAGGEHRHDHTMDYYLERIDRGDWAPDPDNHPDEPGDEDPFGQEVPPSDALRGLLATDGTYTVLMKPTVYNGDNVPEPVIDPAQLSTTSATFVTVDSTGRRQYRVFAQPLSGGGWEVTALSFQAVENTTRHLILIEMGGVVALMLVLGLVGWWVISLGITPMRRMVDASARIAGGDLGVRLDVAGRGHEAGELAASLNSMISTLTGALDEQARSEARLRTFVADASHELRTPLTTVLGYAQLFRKGALGKKADQADAWERTEAEASRMKRLVEDMLELARYDAEPQLHMATTDVSRLVSEVLGDAQRAHPECTFRMTSGSAHTHDAAPVHGLVDADRLRQAVINVVNNAAQVGSTEVTVTVSLTTRGTGANAEDFVTIAVRDNGPGMPPGVAARATERFVRGDASRARSTGGAGLGLAITAAIVDVHGGDLAIDSTPGKGTSVTIAVPA